MRVNLGDRGVAVVEPALEGAQGYAGLEGERRECVTQIVRAEPAQPGNGQPYLDPVPEGVGMADLQGQVGVGAVIEPCEILMYRRGDPQPPLTLRSVLDIGGADPAGRKVDVVTAQAEDLGQAEPGEHRAARETAAAFVRRIIHHREEPRELVRGQASRRDRRLGQTFPMGEGIRIEEYGFFLEIEF